MYIYYFRLQYHNILHTHNVGIIVCNALCYCRSVLSFYEESINIKAQRTLLQPIQFMANLSNSLSSDVTSVPDWSIEANLGNVKVRSCVTS